MSRAGELFQDHAGEGPYIECIDFDEIARWGDAVVWGASNGIGAPPMALAG